MLPTLSGVKGYFQKIQSRMACAFARNMELLEKEIRKKDVQNADPVSFY